MPQPETRNGPRPDPDPPPGADYAATAGSQIVGEPEQGWDRVEVITALRAASARQRDAEIDQIALIAAAADVYSWVDNTAEIAAAMAGSPPASLHGERLWRFGADGTPEVAEFLTLEVGPALGMSPESAALLIGDVLDLRHRLPRTWKLTLAGRVRVWVARKIAQAATRAELDLDTAHELDRHIAPFLPGWTPHQAFARVDLLISHLDPERAETRRKEALERRFVGITSAEAGTARITGQVDGLGGLALDNTLNDLADVIAIGGHHGCHDELRALALETLADPARAADLLNGTLLCHGTEADQPTAGAEGAASGPGNTGATDTGATDTGATDAAATDAGATASVRPGKASEAAPGQAEASDAHTDRADGGRTGTGGARKSGQAGPFGLEPQPRIGVLRLDLRLTAADLIAGTGGESPQLGEVVRSHLQALIAAAGKVVIQPILDPTAPLAADSYAIPDRIRKSVTALYPTVVFPYSNRSSSSGQVDFDHIITWPEGPTDNRNLAPLDRRTHRGKTFAGYRLRTVRGEILHWTTPTGQEYWVTPHGTYDYDPRNAPTPSATLAERARDALRRRKESQASKANQKVRDRLAKETLQPVLLPQPEPPLRWRGDNKPPTPPAQTPEHGAPPF